MTTEQIILQINQAIINRLPVVGCNPTTWNIQANGLLKFVWSSGDKQNLLRLDSGDWLTRDDRYDLQFCHLIDSGIANQETDFQAEKRIHLEKSCLLVGVCKTKLFEEQIMRAFQNVENTQVEAFNTNNQDLLRKYWIIDSKNSSLGYNDWAFAIKYKMTVRLDD